MARQSIHVSRWLCAPADAVWAVAREFCGEWHPFVEGVKAERDVTGQLVRCFRVKGEAGLYRERLTYFSDADRELRYVHVEGIRDVGFYRASLKVSSDGNGCTITWAAEVEAAEPRASDIAAGTRAVFEAGVDALQHLTHLEDARIASTPSLEVTHSAARPGPLVLFLHGIGGSRQNWRRQVVVAARFHQAAAVDLRGYGGSELGAQQTRIGDHCHDILRVMAHFGKTHVILCGMSMGSWIAASFAMRHPEMLAGLVLSGGCTGMSEAATEERQAFLAARQKPLDEGQSPKDFAAQVVAVIAGPHATAEVTHEMLESMAAIPAATYRDALWCFTHPEEKLDFSRFACPVLLMTGEHDKLASPVEIRNVAQRIHEASQKADVGFEIIPGAGHLCNIENPPASDLQLTRFLRRLAV